MVEPLDLCESVMTPLSLVLSCVELEDEDPDIGSGATYGVVDCVDVVLEEDEDCAKAPPAISAKAVVTANKVFIMLLAPRICA